MAAMSLAVASSAEAQIVRRPAQAREPQAWIVGAVGYEQLGDVVDGASESTWRFSDAVQYRVSLEKPMPGNIAFGIAATFARAPLTYESSATIGRCAGSCDADANITQVLALFHAGGSSFGFSQILNLGIGTRIYSNFRERVSGAKIGPTNADADVTFQFGYGFGYGLSPDLQVEIVQDLATTIHQRTGLAGGERTNSQQYTTRIGVRYALGR